MDLKVGDKVICVDSSPGNNRPSLLVEGKSYLVTSVLLYSCGRYGVSVGVVEKDFHQAQCKCGRIVILGKERNYRPDRFIKEDVDKVISDEIREALNEDIKVKN